MHRTYIYIIGLVFVALFASCNDDWTEVESLEIDNKKFETENEEGYAQYLDNLRNYKKSPHKVSFVTFDNSVQKTYSKAQHIRVLPDSLDMVSLTCPNNLPQWQYEEMRKVQSEKGTRFILTIDFEGVKLVYDKMKSKLEDSEKPEDKEALDQLPDFGSFFTDSLQNCIVAVKKYGYDGINFKYKGDYLQLKSEIEKMELKRQQNLMVSIIKHWKSKNEDKFLLFEGLPQNLLNKGFLTDCNYIIVVANRVIGSSGISLKILATISEGVPTDRFIVAVDNISDDPQKANQGYWRGNIRATDGAAKYVVGDHNGFTTMGLSMYEVNSDFYSTGIVYENVRRAIGKMNPTLKK